MKISPDELKRLESQGRVTYAGAPNHSEKPNSSTPPSREAVASCAMDGETQAYELAFYVEGIPETKGSMSSFIHPTAKTKSGKPLIVSKHGGDKKRQIRLKCWSEAIAKVAAAQAAKMAWPCDDKAVEIKMRFSVPRPAGHFGKKGLRKSAPLYPRTKSRDLDKLERCALDALTGVAYIDDSQVCRIDSRKEFAVGHPGASIVVRKLG